MSIEGTSFNPSMADEDEPKVQLDKVMDSGEKGDDVSRRLAELAAADQAEREARRDEEGWVNIVEADRRRRGEVARLWQERPEAFGLAEDFANAALIFQHGEKEVDFDQALAFAKEAVRRGQSPVQSLIPQAFDRRMMAQFREFGAPMDGWRQRYGTQTLYREGEPYAPETDGSAEAEELSYYGLNPLGEGKTRAQARQAAEDRWLAMSEDERKLAADYLVRRAG